MKLIYATLITIFVLFNSSNCFAQDSLKISVKISFYAQDSLGNRYNKCDSNSTFGIKVDITNITNDSMRFWLWNCIYSNNFISSRANLAFCQEVCRNSQPREIELIPNEKFILFLKLAESKSIRKDFKIGFIMSETDDECYYLTHSLKKIENNKIIWSNSLKSK